jgi:hypothetical protein
MHLGEGGGFHPRRPQELLRQAGVAGSDQMPIRYEQNARSIAFSDHLTQPTHGARPKQDSG